MVYIFREVMFYDNMIHFSTYCFYYRCFILVVVVVVVVVVLFGFLFLMELFHDLSYKIPCWEEVFQLVFC